MPGPEIEPRTMACQADVLTTTIPRLTKSGHFALRGHDLDVFYPDHRYFKVEAISFTPLCTYPLDETL